MTSRLKGRYVISAGELSGDYIAAEFVKVWSQKFPEHKAYGVVGPKMKEQGVEPLASMDTFSVMGITEILGQIHSLGMAEKKLCYDIQRVDPDFVLCIDSFGLHARLAKNMHSLQIPFYQYVAPKLWAWGGWRVQTLKKYFRRCFGILDFEADFFKKHGVHFEYVGSPHWGRIPDSIIDKQIGPKVESSPVFALLPGSRRGEIRWIWPTLLEIKKQIAQKLPSARFLVPVAEGLKDQRWIQAEDRITYVDASSQSSLEVMAQADVAILASGTASLECAMVGTPMIVVYKMSALNYLLAKTFVSLPYVSLVNLIFQKKVVAEYIQDIPVAQVVDEALELLKDASYQKLCFEELKSRLPSAPEHKVLASISGDFL